jgi:hypothetical protein
LSAADALGLDPDQTRGLLMPLSNRRRFVWQAALGALLILVVAGSETATAADTWGSITATEAPVVVQPVPVQPLRAWWPRPKPLFPAGYAGVTYPPVGTRWRAMRANYAFAQAPHRPWFGKLKKARQ